MSTVEHNRLGDIDIIIMIIILIIIIIIIILIILIIITSPIIITTIMMIFSRLCCLAVCFKDGDVKLISSYDDVSPQVTMIFLSVIWYFLH